MDYRITTFIPNPKNKDRLQHQAWCKQKEMLVLPSLVAYQIKVLVVRFNDIIFVTTYASRRSSKPKRTHSLRTIIRRKAVESFPVSTLRIITLLISLNLVMLKEEHLKKKTLLVKDLKVLHRNLKQNSIVHVDSPIVIGYHFP